MRSYVTHTGNPFCNEPCLWPSRFVQYPFDKTKMAEVREWIGTTGLVNSPRKESGIKDVETSFCPGEGWLAVRYIFNDLEDMKSYLGSPALENAKKVVFSQASVDYRSEGSGARQLPALELFCTTTPTGRGCCPPLRLQSPAS